MNLVHLLRSAFAPRRTARATPTRRLAVERLEARTTPSTGGLLDPTFGSGGIVTTSFSTTFSQASIAEDILVQSDGKIVAAGWAQLGVKTPNNDFLVARYNANGTLDTSFGSGGRASTDFGGDNDRAYGAALQPGTNGKIVTGGVATIITGHGTKTTSTTDFAVARYNANGTLDTSFGNNGKVVTALGTGGATAYAMAVQPDGQIILAGVTSGGNLTLVRYTANGALDTTFGSGGKLLTSITIDAVRPEHEHVVAVSVQTDGRIVVAADVNAPSGPDFMLARFNANGSTDTSFGGGTGMVTTDFSSRRDYTSGLSIQADGRIVVGGSSSSGSAGSLSVAVARYNPNGTLDTSFGSGGTVIAPFPAPSDPTQTNIGGAQDVSIQADGRIVVGGYEVTDDSAGMPVPGTARAIAERFNANGTVDTGYGTAGTGITGITEVPINAASEVEAMTIQPDGKVVFIGYTGYSTSKALDFALFRLLSSAPQVGSFAAGPNPVTAGSLATLTAGGLTDGNPNSTITQVAFYYIDGTGAKQVLGYGAADGQGNWALSFTVNLAPGSYTLYAQAQDSYGALGDPFALTLQVQ
jgi:uncharacterized delta-60 repeat protein